MTTTPDMYAAGLKMLASLGMVLAIMLGLLYLVRKFTGQPGGALGGRQIQVIERMPLGVKKSICLVRVPGKVLVVGVSNDRINLLESVDAELVAPERCVAADEPFAPMLSRRLKQMTRGFKGKDAP